MDNDYSLVPVDYQPDFSGYSLVPVDYDPFAGDGHAGGEGVTQAQATQSGQAQPGENQKQLSMQAGYSSSDRPMQFSDNKNADQLSQRESVDAPQLAPPTTPAEEYYGNTGSSQQQYSMATHAAYSRCVDKCLHLMSSPSGDLQSSEFRRCVAQCMGRL